MEKQEKRKKQDMKNQNFGSENSKISTNQQTQRDKALPWWVELFFVQIGLPEKLLIKILKINKNSKEFIQNDKKFVLQFLLVLISLIYLHPVIKYSRNKLDCEAIARDYIIKNNNPKKDRRQISMQSTNFSNGGGDIDEIKKLYK